MDRLFTPWRYAFISAQKSDECVFCAKLAMSDEEALIVCRGKQCYVCLNTYPYNNGHVMVIPFAHVSNLSDVPHHAAVEMMELAQLTETVLRREYSPDGINMGMNLGKAAGAGVAGHVHLHALPRWIGDANFMTVVAETRVLPEDLAQTWTRLRKAYAELADDLSS